MPKSKSLIGLRFGRFLVIARGPDRILSSGKVLETCVCRCDCGKEVVVLKASLTRKRSTLSCRCLAKEVTSKLKTVHGMYGTHIYSEWKGMKSRAQYEGGASYGNYGGRGIAVCERWQTFENFLADMGVGKKGWTLERINNDDGYHLYNCCWATQAHQNCNKRTTVRLTFNGETDLALNWSKRLGIKYITLMTRIYDGWSVDDAVTTPVRKR